MEKYVLTFNTDQMYRDFEKRYSKKIRRKIHHGIIRTIDVLMFFSCIIGICGIDRETNDLRLLVAMIVVPMIWLGLRELAENKTRR